MAQNLNLDLPAGDLAEDSMVAHLRRGLPSMPSPIAANSCLDHSRKACFTMPSALSFPNSAGNARSTGTRTSGFCPTGLGRTQKRVVEHAGHCFLPGERCKPSELTQSGQRGQGGGRNAMLTRVVEPLVSVCAK
jgi:hypothetical protein